MSERAVQLLFLKDFGGLIVSCIALVISATTAYFTFWRRKESLGIVVNRMPLIMPSDSDWIIEGECEITFVNDGNRPVCLLSVVMLFEQTSVANQTSIDKGGTYPFITSPFVVERGQIVTQKFKLGGKDIFEGRATVRDEPDRPLKAIMGLRFEYVTPHLGVSHADVPLVAIRKQGGFQIEHLLGRGAITPIVGS